MSNLINRLIDRMAFAVMQRRLVRSREWAKTADLLALRNLRTRSRELRRRLDQVLNVADGRLTLPLIGTNAIQKPLHADWAYRPEVWRGPVAPPGIAAVENGTSIGEEVRLYHDCKISEVTLRQTRNTRDEDLAPFGLRLDVFRFDGSFMSLVVELPGSAVEGLKKRHLFRMTAQVDMEKPLEIFARLNIQHGPNTEQLVREVPLDHGESVVEFDLAYSNLNEKRVERAWVDLIVENPDMNQIVLRDLTFTRRPRAEV